LTAAPAEAFINLDPCRWYRTLSPAKMGEGNHADVWAAFVIQPQSMARVRTTAPACASATPMRKATGPQAARSGVRCCCSSRLVCRATLVRAAVRAPGKCGCPGRLQPVARESGPDVQYLRGSHSVAYRRPPPGQQL